MTVATHHDAKVRGVEWLLGQGARNIRLVVVTPPEEVVRSFDSKQRMDVLELVLESV